MLQNVCISKYVEKQDILLVASHSFVSTPAGTGTVSCSSSFVTLSSNWAVYFSNKYVFPFSSLLLYSSVTGFLEFAVPKRLLLKTYEVNFILKL